MFADSSPSGESSQITMLRGKMEIVDTEFCNKIRNIWDYVIIFWISLEGELRKLPQGVL